MGINVDYYQKIVFITSPTTTVTVQELVDAMRNAEDSDEGMSFGDPVKTITDGFADAEGLAALGGGFSTVITLTLDTEWYIEFWDGVSLGTVADGNIAGGKDNRPVRATIASADTVLVLGAERGVSTAASGPLSAGDIEDIVDGVWDEQTADHTTIGTYGNELATKADIAASSSTDQTFASSGTVLVGSNSSGSYLDTLTRNSIYWEIDEIVSGLTVEMTFYIPDDNRPSVVNVFGHYIGTPSPSHYMQLWAYNYESSSWEQLAEQFMPGGNVTDLEVEEDYFERHIDRTNSNEVKIRLIHNITSYNATHFMDLDYVAVESIDVVTAAEIANAVWEEDVSSYTTSGTFGSIFGKMWRKIKFIAGEI